MHESQRNFLDDLLNAHSPSGFETDTLDIWTEYVESFADSITRDEYGNTVAVHTGGDDTDTSIAFAGHADEIGYMVRDITSDGLLNLRRVGGSDKTVSRGQRVVIHTRDGELPGIIGQTAIHLRSSSEATSIANQYVDIGVDDREEAENLVEIGDPITIQTTIQQLHGDRLVGRAMDNRVGLWAAAEGLRRAVERDVDATVYAIATVQEELGKKGAQMLAPDLSPDLFIAIDVTHATDTPDVPSEKTNGVSLGEGPVIGRGSANHPRLVELLRTAADEAGVECQLKASGRGTGTDADAAYTSRGGIPSVRLGLPNRYMHTPVELIDTTDLTQLATVLAEASVRAPTVSFDTI